jgi:8-oxo-dGTP pyrophosphatase MutT (NUDIX family)
MMQSNGVENKFGAELAELIRLIQKYRSRYPDESVRVDRLLEFIQKNPDHCADRSLSIGHLTGSAWVLNKVRTHTLLTEHRKLKKWLQLGGHADGELDLLEVAKREALEESGLKEISPIFREIFDIDIHKIPARPQANEPEHFHFDCRFVFECHGSEDFVVSHESLTLQWIPLVSLEDFSKEESVLRMKRKTALITAIFQSEPGM